MPIAAGEGSLRGAQWVRFGRYEITNDVVHPVPGEKLEPYDPWDEYVAIWQRRQRQPRNKDDPSGSKRRTPRLVPAYQKLLQLAPKLQTYESDNRLPIQGEVHLTPGQRRRILDWCQEYGLLGLLHHETLEVCLAPVWEQGEQCETQVHAVAHAWQRSGAGWVHHRHRYLHVTEADTLRIGQQVPVTSYGDLRAPRAAEASRGLRLSAEQIASMPKSMLETVGPAGGLIRQPLGSDGLEVAPLEGCWRGHFPTRPEWQTPRWPMPSPHSEEFWRSYGEPLAAIVDAAAQLRWILDVIAAHLPKHVRPTPRQRGQLTAAVDHLASFTSNTWPRADLDAEGKPRVRWAAPSLLGSFALMIMLDFAGKGTVRVCKRCGTPFTSPAPIAIYCSDRCRQAVDKANYREKHPKGSGSSGA
ncbi:MAG TPA: hypothetical protein VFH61_17030 [Thermoleophilia bacterium]|nr:hypothetical protein [Thermoleophilia bacterium]